MVTEIPWGDGTSDKIYLTYTAASGDQTILVSSDANAGPARTKDITFVSSIGNIARVLTVTQETNMNYVSITWNDTCITYNDTAIAYPYEEEYIVFADPLVEQICATNWGDGIGITPSQAAQVTDIGKVFSSSAITSFNELGEYFTKVTSLSGANTGATAFNSCTGLESITIPSSVTSIGARAFSGCSSLKSFVFPASVVSFGNNILYGCSALEYVEVNSDIQTINFTSANTSFGSGIGTLLINANLLVDARYTFGFNFNTIHVAGNIEDIVNGTRVCFASNNLEKVIVDGNVIRSYLLISSTSIKFFELGGTYNDTILPSGGSNIIMHLKYNGIAGTPTNAKIAVVSKVYVDSQAVLNQYLADSNWSAYSSKLDLWENYNGEYKD